MEDVKGKAKEVIGTFTGRNDLVREGKAQQDKAEAQRNAARKEAEAEKARAKAKVQEARQKVEQW
ncbi:MAG TPA: CsbD family protein [Mycobacterium sp.]|nr:CsbD family protein [Mycobacterium sp.]